MRRNKLLLCLIPLLLACFPLRAAEDPVAAAESFYRINSVKRTHSTSVQDGGIRRIEQSLAACWVRDGRLFLRLDAGLAVSGKGVNAQQDIGPSDVWTLKEDKGMAHYVLRGLGADFAEMDFVQFIKGVDGKPSELRYPMRLHYSPPLQVAVWEGRDAEFTALLKQPAAVGALDHRGRDALMLAAYRGLLAKTDTLLRAGAEVMRKDREGQTALMLGAAHPDILKRLLEAGADPLARDAQGFDALSYAMTNADSVRLLLTALPEAARRETANAFVWGLVKGRPESLTLLLQGGLPKDAKHLGRSLKQWAIYHKRGDALALLEQ